MLVHSIYSAEFPHQNEINVQLSFFLLERESFPFKEFSFLKEATFRNSVIIQRNELSIEHNFAIFQRRKRIFPFKSLIQFSHPLNCWCTRKGGWEQKKAFNNGTSSLKNRIRVGERKLNRSATMHSKQKVL